MPVRLHTARFCAWILANVSAFIAGVVRRAETPDNWPNGLLRIPVAVDRELAGNMEAKAVSSLRECFIVLGVASFILAGCASIGRLIDPEYFQTQSSMQLCMDLLSSSSVNVNRSARFEELARRGEICSQYMGAAVVQAERDRQTTDTLIDASKALTPSPSRRITCHKNPNGSVSCD